MSVCRQLDALNMNIKSLEQKLLSKFNTYPTTTERKILTEEAMRTISLPTAASIDNHVGRYIPS